MINTQSQALNVQMLDSTNYYSPAPYYSPQPEPIPLSGTHCTNTLNYHPYRAPQHTVCYNMENIMYKPQGAMGLPYPNSSCHPETTTHYAYYVDQRTQKKMQKKNPDPCLYCQKRKKRCTPAGNTCELCLIKGTGRCPPKPKKMKKRVTSQGIKGQTSLEQWKAQVEYKTENTQTSVEERFSGFSLE
ncbi:hypothetical protein PNOK_0065100 [Pyrrhoderma noxium]|uniref:Zn(2)-C6 fungal-type domain-containing protein n=1 Tax=Pyrrhoderma noxium TaxID=2282107 RepID=A0A286UVF0_9AGAM|nr:hypothetical protein PNOK_0065100 [Pyrrhoderma noxium]